MNSNTLDEQFIEPGRQFNKFRLTYCSQESLKLQDGECFSKSIFLSMFPIFVFVPFLIKNFEKDGLSQLYYLKFLSEFKRDLL